MSLEKEQRGKKQRLSRGQAINRRRILAETRQSAIFSDQKIVERGQAERRIDEVKALLASENLGLSVFTPQELDQNRARLEVEQIWLQLKLGYISESDKFKQLNEKLRLWQQTKPEVYRALTTENERGISMMEQIRDQILPPLRFSGYYTKR